MADLSFEHIDRGRGFDFGRAAPDYARYRDIYPASLFEKMQMFGIVRPGMKVLDVGTGTGVLPRGLYASGAQFCATDIAEAQIEQAKMRSEGMAIDYAAAPAEHAPFAAGSFDLVTACQCFWYFRIPEFIAELRRVLKPGGKFCRIIMEWLPHESRIAAETERIVLQCNPNWGGDGFTVEEFCFPDWAKGVFELETFHSYREELPFTSDSWTGRMRSCRGIGASLPPEEVAQFDAALRRHLEENYPADFTIAHYIQIEVFRI